jgi:DNA adenine methylase
LNDADPAIAAFWRSALDSADDIIRLIRDTRVTVQEWRRQKNIYLNPSEHSMVEFGYAAFFLNRTNRSGIIMNGGPIGGTAQTGEWKIDARFGRASLIRRIQQINAFKNRISISQMDAISFLRKSAKGIRKNLFAYLDPPYYVKGPVLYLNHYVPDDHAKLALYLSQVDYPWALTYDRVQKILDLYKGFDKIPFTLSYSARKRRMGKEILIFSDRTLIPRTWKSSLPRKMFTTRSISSTMP